MSEGTRYLDPINTRSPEMRWMRCSTLLLTFLAVTFSAFAFAEQPLEYDFERLRRLSAALDNFNYSEEAPKSITVWLQGSGIGNPAMLDRDERDLTAVISSWGHKFKDRTRNNLKDIDLANVAVLRADGRTIQFFDMQEFVKTNRPSEIIVKRGDLVALLVRRTPRAG